MRLCPQDSIELGEVVAFLDRQYSQQFATGGEIDERDFLITDYGALASPAPAKVMATAPPAGGFASPTPLAGRTGTLSRGAAGARGAALSELNFFVWHTSVCSVAQSQQLVQLLAVVSHMRSLLPQCGVACGSHVSGAMYNARPFPQPNRLNRRAYPWYLAARSGRSRASGPALPSAYQPPRTRARDTPQRSAHGCLLAAPAGCGRARGAGADAARPAGRVRARRCRCAARESSGHGARGDFGLVKRGRCAGAVGDHGRGAWRP